MAEFYQTTDPISDDQFLASAVRFLLDGGDRDAAKVLLACTVNLEWLQDTKDFLYNESEWTETITRVVHTLEKITLLANRTAFDALDDPNNKTRSKMFKAFGALLSEFVWQNAEFEMRADVIEIDDNWTETLWQISEDKLADNQENWYSTNVYHWLGFRFSSKTEIRIAQALDKQGVLFFPNCRARMGSPQKRTKGAPDFLVSHNGKWGILEVDGEPFHPPQRAAQHHEDDRIYKENHTLKVIERFDASECFENADGVVKRFLKILEQS